MPEIEATGVWWADGGEPLTHMLGLASLGVALTSRLGHKPR